MSFDYLKDHLSPEMLEKYGPKLDKPAEPEPPAPTPSAAAVEPTSSTTTTETPQGQAQEPEETETTGTAGGGEESVAGMGKTEDASADHDPVEPKEGAQGEESATNDATNNN